MPGNERLAWLMPAALVASAHARSITTRAQTARITTPMPTPTQAKMFQFDKAADLLDKLVKIRPQEAEAWRLLGETSLLAQQSARSVAAYESAVAIKDGDLQFTTVGAGVVRGGGGRGALPSLKGCWW
jgi:cytochrome c-type biogenesis protein CcmH/NrfG